MIPQLTTGVLSRILSGDHVDNPVLQLLGHKQIPGSAERYRLMLSDGVNTYCVSMLATQLNNRLKNGEFEKHTIVKLTRYNVNKVQPEKKIIILLELTVLASGENVKDRIGNPTALDSKSNEVSNQNQANRINSNEQKYNPSGYQQGFQNQMNNTSLDNSNINAHPISSLTPYQNKWTIKARVTNKTPIRTWSNSRGEGKLFSLDLLDESGEIRATAFNDQCDKFFDNVEVNKVYYISKASLKTANKKFSSINNDYEMSFTAETTVVSCNENVASIPMLQFDFTSISQIQNVDKDAIIDVIGICKSASDIQTFTSKNTNKELKKRDITLLDKSCTEISLTLWGAEAEKFDGSMNPVLAIKGAKVSDFGGRSLSTLNSSVLQLNPDIREAHMLQGWYDSEGSTINTQSITVKGGGTGMNASWKTFAQVKAENLGTGEKPDYFSSKATVIMIKRDNCLYQACPQEDCNKKVVDLNNGLYRCEKCSREYDTYKWRLLLSVNLADFTESQWVTCFQESAEAILGTTADELGKMKEMNEDRYNEIVNNANFKSFIFRLRVKMENFNEESRLKTVVFSSTALNPVDYGKKLLTDIKNLEEAL